MSIVLPNAVNMENNILGYEGMGPNVTFQGASGRFETIRVTFKTQAAYIGYQRRIEEQMKQFMN